MRWLRSNQCIAKCCEQASLKIHKILQRSKNDLMNEESESFVQQKAKTSRDKINKKKKKME